MKKNNCPTCGTECKVVGNVTMHYEPVKPKLSPHRLKIIISTADLFKDNVVYTDKDSINVDNIVEAIIDNQEDLYE